MEGKFYVGSDATFSLPWRGNFVWGTQNFPSVTREGKFYVPPPPPPLRHMVRVRVRARVRARVGVGVRFMYFQRPYIKFPLHRV